MILVFLIWCWGFMFCLLIAWVALLHLALLKERARMNSFEDWFLNKAWATHLEAHKKMALDASKVAP